jgi:glycosyltransferase involved in cell wall biosynthesis
MMIDNTPLVTVYIPTYNRVDLLKRAVESVRQQTYKNLEIIIVDDCSIDETKSYLECISQIDDRIKYFLKERNSGACISRNIAIQNASGDFITGLDDDDYFLENRIQFFMDNIHYLNEHIFLYSYFFIKNKKELKKNKIEFLKPEIIKSKDLLSFNYVNNQIFTKTDRLKLKCFNGNLDAWQDLYAWFNLLGRDGSARILRNSTYVMDISHEYDRISNKKLIKIQKSYKMMCDDFMLNKIERKILHSQLAAYSDKSLLSIILAFFNSLNFYAFFATYFRIKK